MIAAIIQARMGSTRLSGKVMKQLADRTVLAHVIERVKQSKLIDDIIIATTVGDQDDVIEAEAVRYGAKVFRGSESDVLSRYYEAAEKYGADTIVRITSDCPVIDPHVIDEIVQCYQGGKYDIVTNAGSDLAQRTYPRGLDTEVFSIQALKEAFEQGTESYQREHVTPFIYEHSDYVYFYKQERDDSQYRWTLDTEEDFALIKEIYDRLYKGQHDFYLDDIVRLVEQEPELTKINAHIEQKKLK